ncbi:Uncharacterised protein [Escherichia coli]|uniref:Uncharacterized protein n=1 Tax=Escherichia coli TaxID=562 RepID=A0A484X2N0_ECOLX|nr:Uncharacterised protein [Escherichia coli]
MASSVSPCSAKVFIRFDSRCSAACPGCAPLPSAYPATAHQWCCQCCRLLVSFRTGIHAAVTLIKRRGRHRTHGALVVKNFDTFTVDIVRRNVRQTRKTGGNFLFAVLVQLRICFRMPDLMASRRRAGATVCSRRIRSRTRFGSISGKKNVFLITGSSPAGCGMTTVPSPDTGASFRGIISVIMTTSEKSGGGRRCSVR